MRPRTFIIIGSCVFIIVMIMNIINTKTLYDQTKINVNSYAFVNDRQLQKNMHYTNARKITNTHYEYFFYFLKFVFKTF